MLAIPPSLQQVVALKQALQDSTPYNNRHSGVPSGPVPSAAGKEPRVIASLPRKGWASWDATRDSRHDVVKLRSTECCPCPFAGPGRF